MKTDFWIASHWILLALLASIFSVRFSISVALMEAIVGIIAGNLFTIEITHWVEFLAEFGAITLTFLAGAEIDPKLLREGLKESLVIGLLSVLMPLLLVFAITHYFFGWSIAAAKIAGISLSTTSVAVLYAVMVETGLSHQRLGQSILAACFITDFGTVIGLGILFTGFSVKMLWLAAILFIVIYAALPIARRLFSKYGGQVSEPEIKFIFLVLTFLAYQAVINKSEPVLTAFIFGIAMAGFFNQYKETLHKLRAIMFAAFTPFYFIKAGVLVSLPAVYSMTGVILVLLLLKVVAKFAGVLPSMLLFRYPRRVGIYTSLLMSTGLTFGTIAALYGLNNNLIDSNQYSALVGTVILSAVIPTLIAQRYFFPAPWIK